jgi:hypothetical protein
MTDEVRGRGELLPEAEGGDQAPIALQVLSSQIIQ